MRKFISLLIVTLLMIMLGVGTVSCSKSNPNYQWQTISKVEAFNFLYYSNNIQGAFTPHSPVEITSDPYCVPSIKWVEEVYCPALTKFLTDNGVWSGTDPDNNCVKFSAYGLAVGSILHAKGEGPRKTSLAIGLCDYVKTFYEWHSIDVFIVHDDNGKLQLYYLEPQNRTRIPDREVDSEWWAVRM